MSSARAKNILIIGLSASTLISVPGSLWLAFGNRNAEYRIDLDGTRIDAPLPSISLKDSRGRTIGIQIYDPTGPLARMPKSKAFNVAGVDYSLDVSQSDFAAVGINKNVLIVGSGKWTTAEIFELLGHITKVAKRP